MRKYIQIATVGIFIFLYSTNVLHAQPGSNCECSACHIPCSSPASAHTDPDCNIVKNRKNQSSGKVAAPSLEQQITTQIFSSILSNIFSPKKKQSQQDIKAEEDRLKQEAIIRQQRLAELLRRQAKYDDSVFQAKHDKMTKDFKPLDSSGSLSYKGIDDEMPKPVVHFNCKVTSFKGDIKIFKSNGKEVVLAENQSVELAAGDWLATGANSMIKLHYAFESGGEDIILGQKSVLRVEKDEEGNNYPMIKHGNWYGANNLVEEKVAETTEELISLRNGIYEKAIQKSNAMMRVRTGAATCSIRGTEYTIAVDSLGNTELRVFKGIVDLTGDLIKSTITLTKGMKGYVKVTGEIVGPLKIEEKEIVKWWMD